MKVSPDGTRLALPLPCDSVGDSYVELFDFDNATGIVSNGILLPQEHFVYGIEFSPSSQFLYTVDHNNSAAIFYKQVSQYDVTAGSAAAIIASRIIVGAIWNSTTFFNGAAQLAPDGKIYIVPTDHDSLCVINSPDSSGLACNLVVPGLYITMLNDHGLPNIVVKAEFPCAPPSALFSATNHICPGTCTDFTNLSVGADSYLWTFTGANPSMSTDMNPTNICYQNPGMYSVSLIATSTVTGLSDTLTLNNYITVFPFPAPQGITQSGDTLFAIAGAVSYQWKLDGNIIPGATDYFYVAMQSGNYSVVATDANNCEVEAVIIDVIAGLSPPLSKGEGDGVRLFPNPVTETLYFSNFNITGTEVQITIYNMLGKEIYESKNSVAGKEGSIEIDCRQFSSGVYLLHILENDGKSYQNIFMVQ